MLYSRILNNHNHMVITLFYYPDWVHLRIDLWKTSMFFVACLVLKSRINFCLLYVITESLVNIFSGVEQYEVFTFPSASIISSLLDFLLFCFGLIYFENSFFQAFVFVTFIFKLSLATQQTSPFAGQRKRMDPFCCSLCDTCDVWSCNTVSASKARFM